LLNDTRPFVALALCAAIVASAAGAEPAYKADVPASILTPDTVETRIGALRFRDGAPDAETAALAYDNLDFMRGVAAFLDAMPAASIYGVCRGYLEAGMGPQTVGVFEELMDARSVFLTPNSTTVYVSKCYDLEDGPIVVEVPAGVLGPMDDAYFRFIADFGVTGPDKGEGGRYLFAPPGYEGDLPENGYFVFHSPTYTTMQLIRAFVGEDGIEATVRRVKDTMRVYPWAQRDDPPETEFLNLSGMQFNTVHANDFSFYEEIDAVIQKEPAEPCPPRSWARSPASGSRRASPSRRTPACARSSPTRWRSATPRRGRSSSRSGTGAASTFLTGSGRRASSAAAPNSTTMASA
jgi:hypothetical protein